LSVSDDGCGFAPAQIGVDNEGHWGVTSMRERAQQVGARFTLVTSPGAGTTVEMTAALSPTTEPHR
jgi:signal transduction histidine kinase